MCHTRIKVFYLILEALEDNYGDQKNPIAISFDAQGCGVAIGVACLARRVAVHQ
jgi:hypothetical protein